MAQTQTFQLKRPLSGLQYICSSAFSKFDSENEKSIMNEVFVRENISCTTNIKLTYYSDDDIFQRICIHWRTKQNLVPKKIENYPQCCNVEFNKTEV